MTTILGIAKQIIELKNKNLMSSDAFQTACKEFCNETMKTPLRSKEYKEATSLFDSEINKYIAAMDGNLAWSRFKEKYLDQLKF